MRHEGGQSNLRFVNYEIRGRRWQTQLWKTNKAAFKVILILIIKEAKYMAILSWYRVRVTNSTRSIALKVWGLHGCAKSCEETGGLSSAALYIMWRPRQSEMFIYFFRSTWGSRQRLGVTVAYKARDCHLLCSWTAPQCKVPGTWNAFPVLREFVNLQITSFALWLTNEYFYLFTVIPYYFKGAVLSRIDYIASLTLTKDKLRVF
jgi:hypothetical protein